MAGTRRSPASRIISVSASISLSAIAPIFAPLISVVGPRRLRERGISTICYACCRNEALRYHEFSLWVRTSGSYDGPSGVTTISVVFDDT